MAVSQVAYPPFAGEVENNRQFYQDEGLKIRFIPFQGIYDGKSYPKSYTDEELQIFGLKRSNAEWPYRKGSVCNAGCNVARVWPNGVVWPCFYIDKEMGSVYKEIRFEDSLMSCPLSYCGCPLNYHDPYLFEKAKLASSLTNV